MNQETWTNKLGVPRGTPTFKEEQRMSDKLSNRGQQWIEFSSRVLDHIEGYTVPQYGDAPNDQIEDWTAKECVRAISKRCARFGSNSRDGQELLDILKMAHEACLAYDKLEGEQNELEGATTDPEEVWKPIMDKEVQHEKETKV